MIQKSFLKVKELDYMRCNNTFLKSKALKTQFVTSVGNSEVSCQHAWTWEYEQQSKTNILFLGSLSVRKDLLLNNKPLETVLYL